MSQAPSAVNSLAKIKTIGDLKPASICMNSNDVQQLLTQIQGAHRSASRGMERRTVACLSQERAGSHQQQRANLSFVHNAGLNSSATRPFSSNTYKLDPKAGRLRRFGKLLSNYFETLDEVDRIDSCDP